MSYTEYDWYEERFLPLLKEAIKETKDDKEPYGFDKFIAALKRALDLDDIAIDKVRQPLFMAMLEGNSGRKEMPELIEECFGILNYGTDAVINGINYTNGKSINNNINYHINVCSECGEEIEDD